MIILQSQFSHSASKHIPHALASRRNTYSLLSQSYIRTMRSRSFLRFTGQSLGAKPLKVAAFVDVRSLFGGFLLRRTSHGEDNAAFSLCEHDGPGAFIAEATEWIGSARSRFLTDVGIPGCFGESGLHISAPH